MTFKVIRGQGQSHVRLKVSKMTIFKIYLLRHFSTYQKIPTVSDTRPKYLKSLGPDFRPTVLSVAPLVHCLSVVCDVLYCGKTVRPSKKLSEGVNRKPGSKSRFFSVAAIFLLPVSALRPQRRPFLPCFCPYSPAIGTRWHNWTF